MKTQITIKLVSREEFTNIYLQNLLHEHKDHTPEDIFRWFLEHGFAKLDFENLSKSLNGVWFENVAVDINDPMFHWVVAGSSAILIKKS